MRSCRPAAHRKLSVWEMTPEKALKLAALITKAAHEAMLFQDGP